MHLYLNFKSGRSLRVPLKFLLTMKLTLVILTVTFMQVSAASFAQKITLSEKNAPFEKILDELKKQSGYNFLYNTPMLSEAKPVSIEVTNSSIEDVLTLCFKGQPLDYTIKSNTIVIKRKPGLPDLIKPAVAVTVSGKVVDEKGEPLPGVSIVIKGTQTGIVSDVSGRYTITLPTGNETLVFTFIGYTSKEVAVGGRTSIDVQLALENQALSEVVVVGYGTQKKVTLTGAVSSIKSDEIVTTKNENVQNMLTGKIAGVRVKQNTSEPGTFTNAFDIRGLGSPLIIIDGIPRDNIQRLDPNDIESISVLKDASAAVYGVRAANGVVLITTKRGKKGGVELNYSGNFTLQVPSGLPKSQDAIGYMTLRNEAARHNLNDQPIPFAETDFEPYRNGTKKSTDWYTPVIKNSVPQQQHNLSATGGNENTNYFLSLGYTAQDGFLRSGDLNYKRYNVRSNVTSKVTKDLTVDLNISGIFDQKHQPYQDAWWIIRSFWRQNPLDPIYANNNPAYLFQPSVDGTNPISLSNEDIAGYKNYLNRWFQSSISLTYDVPFVKGLKAKALYSYDYNNSEGKTFQREYKQYTYNAANDTYNAQLQQSPNRVYNDYFSRPTSLSQISLNYDNVFKQDHSVSALILLENALNQSDNFSAQRDVSLPLDYLFAGNSLNQVGSMDKGNLYNYTRVGLVGRVNYAFKSKYLAEFSFRRDGSSKNSPLSRYGFFPAGQIGWRVSEEDFIKKNTAFSFVDNLKIRATYGLVGDDSNVAYQWVQGYNYPASGNYNEYTPGYFFNGAFINALSPTNVPNLYLTWIKSKTLDIGVDFEGWKGLLGLTVDYFKRDRKGLLANKIGTVPGVVGAGLPQENLENDRSEGLDVEINHRNRIGKFGYTLKGIFSYTRTRWTYREQSAAGSSYDLWRGKETGRYNNIRWGYGANGQFQSYNDIINSPVAVGSGTVVGDYAYEDWNGDGIINGNDQHPIAYTGIPLVNFGLTIGLDYKGFDANFLLQGSTKANVSYIEQLREPQWGGGSGLAQFMDRWHPADPTANPYSPNTVWVPGHFAYTGVQPDVNSTFNVQDATYLRLKSAEIGYTFPAKMISKIGIKGARIFVNGYNLFTISDIKYVDPEHPEDLYGYIYPLNKTYSVGLNVKF
jgi:TonB-linked SusC/RagA family outer membrane protein